MTRVPWAIFPITLWILLATALPAGAQDDDGGLLTRNPLDVIKDELVQVLQGAGVPFTAEQDQAIIFVLEESRRASEQLFGNIMNFSSGPPRGEQLDRAMAGIAWMNEDFSDRVREYLTPEQLLVWDAHVESRAADIEESEGTAGTSRQIQQIRINRNAFTAERQYSGSASSGGSYGFASGGGVQTQIFQRGGTGAWHGNAGFVFRDESLNARNPFASNRPPYQQRNISLSTNGPLIRNRLTINGGFSRSQADNAATINALTLDGPFTLGFTRPQTSRSGNFGGTYQLTTRQSMDFRSTVSRQTYEKQGMGGVSLPERAITYQTGTDRLGVGHLWYISDRLVQDISFDVYENFQNSEPETDDRSINVLNAFSGGGGQNRASSNNRYFIVDSLWIYTGDRWAIRTGGNLQRTSTNERTEDNFLGTFIFSNLESYRDGQPILYTENRGDPLLVNVQTEWSMFLQNEFQVTDRFALFFGLRYERQTNLDDHNNLDPRVGVAYALGNSTVVRAGVGIFHMRVSNSVENTLARFDGTRQVQIEINDPSYPNPFLSGDVTIVPPSSRRVRADDLAAPVSINTSYQIERSFAYNLFVTASFDYHRRYHLLRSRNLNVRLPGQTERPDPSEGNIWLLESSGISKFKTFRLTMRQRFSIFNLNANYAREVSGTVIAGFTAPTNNFDLRADYAETVQHQFSTTMNNRLFWDIFLNTSISYRNGNWYTITTGKDDNGDGQTNDRPLVVNGYEKDVSRYSARGPHQGNVTFNLTKSISLGSNSNGGGSPSLNFRANFANAFNRTNLGTPIGNLSSSRFGEIISASNPRRITLELRFQF